MAIPHTLYAEKEADKIVRPVGRPVGRPCGSGQHEAAPTDPMSVEAANEKKAPEAVCKALFGNLSGFD